jgi:uncharacterized protein (TIGR02186 family)
MKTATFRLAAAAFMLLLLTVTLRPAHAAGDSTIEVTPQAVVMGAQYNGQNLTVTGTVPEGTDVVLRFTGAPADMHLREKGKLFGLLWMNVGKVSVKNVPRVCLVDSSRPFDQIGAAATPFRLEGLRDAIEIEEAAKSPDLDIAHELVLLKQRDGLYHESEGGVQLAPAADGVQQFTATLHVPSALATGKYVVEAIALHDGTVVNKASVPVEAKLTGFPLWLNNLAFDNGLMYGIMATLVAIFSGLAIGMVFQSKGAH